MEPNFLVPWIFSVHGENFSENFSALWNFSNLLKGHTFAKKFKNKRIDISRIYLKFHVDFQ